MHEFLPPFCTSNGPAEDSDLVIFGTQRHGVPKMPEVKGGTGMGCRTVWLGRPVGNAQLITSGQLSILRVNTRHHFRLFPVLVWDDLGRSDHSADLFLPHEHADAWICQAG